MDFNNKLMLFGLLAVLVPILIHLLNRSRAKILDWGAMRFLLASLTSQNRRILIEEIILLTLRCLLVALVVLAMAQPLLVRRWSVAWAIVLPVLLGAVVCLAVAGAMWVNRRARWALLGVACFLAAVGGLASVWRELFPDDLWGLRRGERDVAIVLDASMSMTLLVEDETNFERAVEVARQVVGACGSGDAVSLILAGPVPRPVLATPTADRARIAAALEKLEPIGGAMSVLEALNVAAASLAEGRNAAKKIVLITDGQNVGWDVRSEARWRFLAEGLKGLPIRPKIICHKLPLPRAYRNLAVADVAFSRRVVGTDRPVKIHVKVMNTGTVPLRPTGVELVVDGASVATERGVTDIPPRAAETFRFEHRFKHAGPRLVSAQVLLPDDLPADNAGSRVLNVIGKLSVLVVDGVPSDRPLGGAAAFVELALTPRSNDAPSRGLQGPREGKPDAEPDAEAIKDADDLRYLVEPKVVPAPGIASVGSLHEYGAVILANVPELPPAVAKDLMSFVQAGGGVLIAPGARAKPSFYNDVWTTPGGQMVVPARLTARREVEETPVRLDPKSFSHPALQLLSDPKQSDAGLALVKSYWKLEADERDSEVRVGGRLSTDEPFLVERKLGKGYVLLTATSLDHAGSNLPALKSFVPMLHETVYYLAAPMMLDANVTPGAEVALELHSRAAGPTPGGEGGRVAEVITPSQRRATAKLSSGNGTLRARFADTQEPGLYTLVLPPDLASRYAPEGAEGKGIPFVALSRVEESFLDTLTKADVAAAGQHVDLFVTDRTDELTAAVAGGVPGQELWKYLILGAVFVLLAEVAVTRWIAIQRRLGAAPTVVFGLEAVDVQTFRERAAQLLALPSATVESEAAASKRGGGG